MKVTPFSHIQMTILLLGACIWFASLSSETLYPGKPQVGIDGSGKFVCLCKGVDDKTLKTTIYGSWGNGFPAQMIQITDPEKFNVKELHMVMSGSSKATTKAAAVWMAKDLSTENHVIQGTVLTTLGWRTTPALLSLNDKSEQPRSDYQVKISDDGQTIIVTWSSFIVSLNDTVLRIALSTNGGLTWNPPVNLIAPPPVKKSDSAEVNAQKP